MNYYLFKIAITTLLIIAISEIAKRSTLAGAVLASIPLVSVLAMTWFYVETRDTTRVSALATSTLWLVIPSLALFIALPALLNTGLNFFVSLGISMAITTCCYFLMIFVLNRFGVLP